MLPQVAREMHTDKQQKRRGICTWSGRLNDFGWTSTKVVCTGTSPNGSTDHLKATENRVSLKDLRTCHDWLLMRRSRLFAQLGTKVGLPGRSCRGVPRWVNQRVVVEGWHRRWERFGILHGCG